MNFASDNRGPAHPKILEAMIAANDGYRPSYGDDDLTTLVQDKIRDQFEAPDAAVYLTATGTATNALILASLAKPWDEIYCAFDSHIRQDECNAVEFYSGGARITHVGTKDRLIPDDLRSAMANAAPHGIHNAQVGPVSIVQVTDLGGVYSLEELSAICDVAKDFGSPVHLDGARFANAMVALGCSPAEMTWKAGVDAVSFGGTKNGCAAVEAAIFFNPDHAQEFELRRKRAGHLFSKHRFLSAQMLGYLEADLWKDLARVSNSRAQALISGLLALGGRLEAPADANVGFLWLPRKMHRALSLGGVVYEMIGDLDGDPDEYLLSRFVCDWSVEEADIEAALNIAASGL